MKHTPGPWFASRPHGTIYIEARLRGNTLQEVAAIGPTETPIQQEANARLIAESPVMFDLLNRIRVGMIDSQDMVDVSDFMDEVIEEVCGVIARVTGEEA